MKGGRRRAPRILGAVKFDRDGLVPAIVQEGLHGRVLMMAYMNREALRRTMKTGLAHFYSRSRRKLWMKGESSGHIQQVRELRVDCDGDAVLLAVRQRGPGACHTGHRSCFFRTRKGAALVVADRPRFSAARVYRRNG